MKLKTKKNSLQIDSINKSKNKKKNKSQDVEEQPQQERVKSKKLGKGKDRSRELEFDQSKRSGELELVESERSDGPEMVQTQEVADRGTAQALDDEHGRDDSDVNADNDHERAEESDSSEDEVAPRNTIGAVPLEWYKEEEHIGYNVTGRKIKKKERQDKLDSFLARVDDAKNWRTVYDELEDEDVELLNREIRTIRRMLKGNAPHAEFDPHAPYVDFFKWDDAKHPLSSAPEPKRRFIPSKSDLKKVVRYVRLIRKGLIKFDKPKEEPKFYPLWGDDATGMDRSSHALAYISAPKTKLPGHEESYNPSLEYIPTQEEINKYELMFEEDRPKFIPKRFESLRSVPAYENLKEMFDRCLDLYLCPRVRKKRINIDPESLKPKLPSPRDLKPYPVNCYLEYKGHSGAVMSISPDASGQWIASGSSDGTVRIWEIETCRCVKVWDLGEAVHYVAWNPLPELPIIAVAMGHDVLILNTGLGTEEQQNKIADLLRVGILHAPDESDDVRSILTWAQYNKYDGIRLEHFKTVTSVEWHRKGDYFSTVMPADILLPSVVK